MADTNKFGQIEAKLMSIDDKIAQLKDQIVEQVIGAVQTSLTSAKEALTSEISQISGNVVTLGNTVTTAVTRESSETKRVVSEGFTEQRNKLSTLPAMQSAVTQAIVECREFLAGSVGDLRSHVETSFTTTNSKVESLSQVVQTAKSDLTNQLDEIEQAVLASDSEILAKCSELKTVTDKVEESVRSLFVAYANMVGEISRLATQAASDFAKDLLLANELRDAVENCEEIIDIFNDLKGTYKTIAEIAAEGLKLFKGEGPMRQIFGKIEAAKDVSFALSSLTNVFRAFKQESRESRFDF